MNKHYYVNVKFTRQNGDDSTTSVSEFFLVNAVSFTDAETIISGYMEDLIRSKEVVGVFNVESMVKREYTEIIFDETGETDYWHEFASTGIVIDHDAGKEVKSKLKFLIQEKNVDTALIKMHEIMQNGTSDSYSIDKFTTTKIQEVLEINLDSNE